VKRRKKEEQGTRKMMRTDALSSNICNLMFASYQEVLRHKYPLALPSTTDQSSL
jgi:hypothetical protein